MYLSQLPDPKQPHREAIIVFCSVVSILNTFLGFTHFPPSFFSPQIPPNACVTRATWQSVMVWCAIKVVIRCISGWGVRKTLCRPTYFVPPQYQAWLPHWKQSFSSEAYGTMSFKKYKHIVVGSPDMGGSLTYLVLYLIFSKVLRFLWPIGHMFMGIFFWLCVVSQLQEEGIKVRDHIGLQGDRQIPWVGWKQHLNCCINKAP